MRIVTQLLVFEVACALMAGVCVGLVLLGSSLVLSVLLVLAAALAIASSWYAETVRRHLP